MKAKPKSTLPKLQIENRKGGWVTIARGAPESMAEEAELFQERGFCMRVKGHDGAITNFFADESHFEGEKHDEAAQWTPPNDPAPAGAGNVQ
jgi:hypothetical protein